MAQCSACADRGHSTRAQWPVIPTVPGPGRYGVDVTSRLVDRSAVSSRRPADIAGVVGALMGHDALSGRLAEAEATGRCRAGFERDGESTSRPRLYACGLGRDEESVPCRGPQREASREAGILQAARGFVYEARSEAESRWVRARPGFNKRLILWLCF